PSIRTLRKRRFGMSSCIGLLERRPHIQAHCQRVAALAGEIAALLALPAESRLVLEQAALIHHAALEAFTAPALDRLVRDVEGSGWRVVGSSGGFGLLGQASDLVRAMQHRGAALENEQ